MKSKLISIGEAASMVNPSDTIALGGVTLYRRPMAFTRELLIRFQKFGEPGKLTLLGFTAGLESDILIGAGMVSTVRTCYFGLEIFGLAPMFTYFANRGDIEIMEETEASLAFGLRATLARIGFMPGRGWLGTDLPKLRPDVRTITDPYSGEELMAFPAIKPDIAVIHALQADPEGNALIGDNKGIDVELSGAADKVIITSEEIVPELHKANIVAPWVDAVVHTHHGALPTSCYPLYGLDGDEILAYSGQVNDLDSWSNYISEWLSI